MKSSLIQNIFYLLIGVPIFCANLSLGQNLVPNSSFENYTTCPSFTGSSSTSATNLAIPWYDPTGSTSDYYNSCDTGFFNVPHSASGYQVARTGDAYTGLFALNGLGALWNNMREYIQVELLSPLEKDTCYQVEFFCNQHNSPAYSVDKLGALLDTTSSFIVSSIPQIISGYFLSDTANWMRVNGYYKAKGGEKFLTIGDFKPFTAGDTLSIFPTGNWNFYWGAYYFIDDVSIIKIQGCDTSLSILNIKNNSDYNFHPNPFTYKTAIKINNSVNKNYELKLYNNNGILIRKTETFASNTIELERKDLINGIYFFELMCEGKFINSGKLVIE